MISSSWRSCPSTVAAGWRSGFAARGATWPITRACTPALSSSWRTRLAFGRRAYDGNVFLAALAAGAGHGSAPDGQQPPPHQRYHAQTPPSIISALEYRHASRKLEPAEINNVPDDDAAHDTPDAEGLIVAAAQVSRSSARPLCRPAPPPPCTAAGTRRAQICGCSSQ